MYLSGLRLYTWSIGTKCFEIDYSTSIVLWMESRSFWVSSYTASSLLLEFRTDAICDWSGVCLKSLLALFYSDTFVS